MPASSHLSARSLLRPLSLALALACAGGAWAQPVSPYYIGVNQTFSHDSNVFRTSTAAVGDTTSSTSLVGGIDQPFGRQHFFANGTLGTNRHQSLSDLNNTSYSLSAGLDWSTIERISGTVRLSANQNLANYGTANAPLLKSRNIESTRVGSASVRYGGAGVLSLDGSVERRAIRYSAIEYVDRENTQDVVGVGLRWVPGGPLSAGVGLRYTKGETPNFLIAPGVYAPDDLDRKDIDLTGTWAPSSATTLSARISLSHETHSQNAYPDFSGVTGSLSWDYRPTGRLGLSAAFSRDTGTSTTFLSFGSQFPAFRIDSNRLSTLSQLAANYEVTAKINLTASASHRSGSVANSGSSDSTSTYGLGARYIPLRNLTLNCNVGRDLRSSSTPGLDSRASTASCSAQFTLQ